MNYDIEFKIAGEGGELQLSFYVKVKSISEGIGISGEVEILGVIVNGHFAPEKTHNAFISMVGWDSIEQRALELEREAS